MGEGDRPNGLAYISWIALQRELRQIHEIHEVHETARIRCPGSPRFDSHTKSDILTLSLNGIEPLSRNPGHRAQLQPVVLSQEIPMRLVFHFSKTYRVLRVVSWLIFGLCSLSIGALGQSTDINTPWPVTSNETTGRIDPRDLGDARFTDHYYAFTGTPGDLLVTVEGKNLNGDVDVFTVSGLRPLLKFSLYAETATPITKSIFLRRREDLIIRVQARTPNDDPGTYRLHFGGAFEPITSGPIFDAAEAMRTQMATPEAATTPGTGRRVSSVGARIEEPPAEVAALPTPEPTPAETPEVAPAETAPGETVTTTPEVTKPAPARTPRGRRLPGRRTRPRPSATAEQPAPAETKPDTEVTAEVEGKPAPGPIRRGGSRRRPTDPPATQEPEVESGPRLLIETNDGTLIDRYMSSVRRVTVENGRVLVVGKDGKIDRIPLANIVRMVIAP